jgi:hypothetical protein
VKRPPLVRWRGARAPSRAELAALARLPAGEYDARPAAALSGPVGAHMAFHWGNAPKRIARVPRPTYPGGLYELGKLRRVEYETTKGRERAIYVHDFTAPYPLLTGTPNGRLGPILGGAAHITPRGIEK